MQLKKHDAVAMGNFSIHALIGYEKSPFFKLETD